jgi:1-acyl-sn-glycerol-3-phosphate acyltransferase
MKEKYPLKEFLRRVFDFVFWVLFDTKIYGQGHVPPTGPVLIVTNHLSYVDPPLIFIGVRRHDMVVLIADKYKSNPFYKWLVENVGGVWINRGSGDRAALKASIEILKQGNLMGMAPEGTRSHTGSLIPGKTGAAFLAVKAGVPLLPIGLTGGETAFNDLKHFRRPKLRMTIGPLFTLPAPDGGLIKSESLDQYTHEIMCRIAALLPKKYHGVYVGDPRIEEIRRETGIKVDR